MLKVFLIGFLCVALTHQSSIGDSLKGQTGLRKKRQFEKFGDMISE